MIREATVGDKPRLIQMAARFILSSRYQEFLTPQPDRIAALIDQVLAHGVIFVAEEYRRYSVAETFGTEVCLSLDKDVVGMLALVGPLPHLLTGQPYGEEVAWWVEPEYRNGTIGPRLMHQMECWSRQNGLHMVKMLAPSDSTVGDFYRKCGYQAVETAWVKVFG